MSWSLAWSMRNRTSLTRLEAYCVCTIGSGVVLGATPVHDVSACRCCAALAVDSKCTTSSRRLRALALQPTAASSDMADTTTPSVRALVTHVSLRVMPDAEPIESYALLGDMQTA